MLKSLKIENFRCFPSFEMQNLGRLNLIVGTNNSGKTSILEAVQLLFNNPLVFDFDILGEIVAARSEYVEEDKYQDRNLVIRHLFHGHQIDIGSQFSITGKDTNDKQTEVIISIQKSRKSNIPTLCVKYTDKYIESGLELSPDRTLSSKLLKESKLNLTEVLSNIQFVNQSSLNTQTAVKLFDELVLTPEEDFVTQSLQTIEPRIKRIAVVSSGKYRYEGYRSGFIVQFSDENQRIPIGSMGDGMWRMLGLALAIVNAKDGVLLVDEIDTGLHFTVMSDMWKMLWETAKRLNVQVFATTHSNDCWQSLADIANAENPSEDGITIHRVEKGKPHSIVFTEDEIAIAAEEGIEVR
jgi:AAA15 family ATPase/GTPase